MTTDLISRARAGDGEAFRALTEPYRRELQVHCYRMLGSLQDAEDALQDTLLAAWQGLGGFEGRASIRTWLYRIATNRCLNALRSANRRRPTSANRLPPPTQPPSRRSWQTSSAPTSPPIWTRWSPCSPTISTSPCHRFPSNTRAATSWPASSPASSARAGGLTSCRREPTVSRRSGPTFAPPPASATGPACSSSPSPATGSAPSPASTTACSHGSGCRDRSRADRQLLSALGIADVNAQRQRPDVLI